MVQTTDSRLMSNTETAFRSGFDGGNTDTCFSTFVSGQERTVIIPSTVIPVIGNKLATLREAVASNIDGEITPYDQYKSDIIIEYNGKAYLVGYSAMRQAKNANTQKGDDTRYYSTEQIIRLLAASALAIPYSHYEIYLITTVPFGYYTKALRQSVKQTLSGEFSFKFNGAERRAIITVKQVLVEGSPALVLYGASSANSRRIVIDGGGYTTEFLTFDGRDPIAQLCKGVELGVETIGDYVTEQLLEKHSRRLVIRERADILRAYGSQKTPFPLRYPEISCGTYIVPDQELHAICHAGALHLAQETMNEAAMVWGKVNDVVAGDILHQYHMGGAVHFCNDIMRAKQMPQLVAVSDSEKANARGCARLAKAIG